MQVEGLHVIHVDLSFVYNVFVWHKAKKQQIPFLSQMWLFYTEPVVRLPSNCFIKKVVES